jgi:hypothetical protein
MWITTCLGTCLALLVHLQVPTITAVWPPDGATVLEVFMGPFSENVSRACRFVRGNVLRVPRRAYRQMQRES